MEEPHNNVTSHSGKRFYALTSLRFFAVAMIVVYHYQGEFGQTYNTDNYFALNQAVSFFFILSGFILAYVYPALKIKDSGRFYLTRFARIWPLHAATFILALLLVPLKPTLRESFPWVILANLTMVHAYVPLWDYFLSFNSVSWAISTEFFFYLCFPFLIYRWRQTWPWKLLLSFILLVAMIIICNVWRLPAQIWVSGISLPGLVYIGPLARIIEFVLGMIIASVWRAKGQYLNIGRATGTIVELTALILTVASIYYTPVISYSPTLRMYCGDAFSYWVSSSGSAPIFGILIFVLSLEKGIISKMLSLPAAVLLGEISYSIYLVHQVLLRFYRSNRSVFLDIPEWGAYVLYCIIVLVVSHLMWKFIEQPCRRLINGLPSRIEGSADKTSQNKPGQGAFVQSHELVTEAGLKTRWMVAGEVLFLVLVSLAVVHRVPQPFYLFQDRVTQVVPEEEKVRPVFPPASLSSSLPEVLSGLTLASGGKCNVEMINNTMVAKGAVISKKEKITLAGWAADVQSGSVPAIIVVQFSTADGNHDFYGTALRFTKRPDVAKAFNNPLFENAGYDLSADISTMPVGQYTIKIIQVAEKKAIVCQTKKELTVSQSLSSSLPEALSGLAFVSGGGCNVEMINNAMITKGAVISKKEKVTLVGWAADVQSGSVPATVIVQFSTADGNHYFYDTALRLTKRPDVAKAFNNPLFENAGYDLSADISAMPAGQYSIKIIQVAEKKAIVCQTKKELTVSQFQ